MASYKKYLACQVSRAFNPPIESATHIQWVFAPDGYTVKDIRNKMEEENPAIAPWYWIVTPTNCARAYARNSAHKEHWQRCILVANEKHNRRCSVSESPERYTDERSLSCH